MQRRDFIKYSSALAVSGLLPKTWAAQEIFTVYGAPALPSLTIAVATMQGELAKRTNASLKIWRNPDQLRAGVAGGEFKVMMSPSNVGVNLRNQGQKVGMVNILTNGITKLIGKKAIHAPEELVGKKIILPFKNDMPDIILRALLKQRGIEESALNITYSATPVEAVALFLSRDFDAAVLPEPLNSACILRGKTMGIDVLRSFDLIKAWGETFNTKPIIPQAGIIADVDYFNANREKFALFHTDLQDALTWVKSNPKSAAEIGANYFPAPSPAIAEAIPHANLTVTAGSELKEEIMIFYDIIMRFNPKLLGGKLPDQAFFLV